MSLIWMHMYDDAYIYRERERTKFLFVIDSSNNYLIGMAEGNPFSQMVRNGTMMMPVSG
jgi:hypothetical protein